jgi:hypothetical protein
MSDFLSDLAKDAIKWTLKKVWEIGSAPSANPPTTDPSFGAGGASGSGYPESGPYRGPYRDNTGFGGGPDHGDANPYTPAPEISARRSETVPVDGMIPDPPESTAVEVPEVLITPDPPPVDAASLPEPPPINIVEVPEVWISSGPDEPGYSQ